MYVRMSYHNIQVSQYAFPYESILFDSVQMSAQHSPATQHYMTTEKCVCVLVFFYFIKEKNISLKKLCKKETNTNSLRKWKNIKPEQVIIRRKCEKPPTHSKCRQGSKIRARILASSHRQNRNRTKKFHRKTERNSQSPIGNCVLIVNKRICYSRKDFNRQ